MVDDRLRRYPHWLASRNLANEASDESVEALLDAVRARVAALDADRVLAGDLATLDEWLREGGCDAALDHVGALR
jgi:oligoendopeptidase F